MYYNSFIRRCSAFDVFFTGINEIRRAAINVFTTRLILKSNVFFFSFDSIWFFSNAFCLLRWKNKQMIKIKTLNLKQMKSSCEKSKQKNVFWYGGHLFPFVSRFGDKDLNNLIEDSKAKSTKKYTTPSKSYNSNKPHSYNR